MGEFVVKQVASFWAVVNNGVIFAQGPTATDAIGKAVALAARAARVDGPRRVIHEKSPQEREIVWDSEKDGSVAE